jgi:hypothetical protein
MAEWSARLRGWRLKMRNAGNASDIRPLTDAELDDVSGGVLGYVVLGAAWTAIVIAGWDLPPTPTARADAAAALGASHIL